VRAPSTYATAARARAKASRRPAHSMQRATGHAVGAPQRSHSGARILGRASTHAVHTCTPPAPQTTHRSGRSSSSITSRYARDARANVDDTKLAHSRAKYARRVAAADNAALARRIFDAFERKDAFVLRELFAEDAVWRVGGTSRLAGVYLGRREIIRFLGSLPRLTGGTYSSRLSDVLASETRAAVIYRATGTREGRTLDIDQLLLFTVRDGCVADVLALPSDQASFDAFWGA
jgi:ketosteroid isomerase-like protein